MNAPADFLSRSFVYRKLMALDASFEALGAAAVAMDFGDPAGEAETARRLGLCDLSPLPRLGVKGAGEGGTIPALASIVGAVEDALSPFGIQLTETPITPARIVELVGAARQGSVA